MEVGAKVGNKSMASIFISYASQDESFVRKLAARLEEAKHSVFYSGATLHAGQKWQDALSSSLREADGVVIIVSEASLGSRWLMAETGAALGYFQERGRPLVLPVVLGNVTLPPLLAQIQAIFAPDPDQDLDKIVGEITRSFDVLLGRIRARQDEQRKVL